SLPEEASVERYSAHAGRPDDRPERSTPAINRSPTMIANRLARGLLAATLAATPAFALAAPVTYTIDPTHTDVIAQWNHLGFSNPIAHFGQVEGTITYDPDNVAASSVEVVLPLAG